MFFSADSHDETVEFVLPLDEFDNYAEQLKSFRKKRKLKQQELAEILGVKHFTLRSWEQKQAKPPYHVWKLFRDLSNNAVDLA